MSDANTQYFMAIDNVCAWPNLTRLSDGTIIATIFNQPCHGKWEGDVECWASTDGGRLWQYRGTPAPHEPGTNRMNVAAGLAGNGDLIVIASGWDKRPTHAQALAGETGTGQQVQRSWVCRSADAGRTWTIDKEAFPSYTPHYIPFGDILPGPDGRLGVCGYDHRPRPGQQMLNSAWFFRSDDDGRTWNQPTLIGADDQNETTPLHLGDGQWIVASRTVGTQQLNLFRSTDDGQTWHFEQPLTLARQHPAHLLRLADGRILLTYGVRNPGGFAICMQTSTDEGKTWFRPHAIATYPDADSGYPSSVQNDDGSITTAWYVAHTPTHNRYHMATAIWQLPGK